MSISKQAEQIREISGVNPYKCMKCGKCSASCPSFNEMDIKPHQFVSYVLNDDIESLVNSKSLWKCLSCFACIERCPRDVKPGKLIDAARQLVVRQRGEAYLTPDEIPELLDLAGSRPLVRLCEHERYIQRSSAENWCICVPLRQQHRSYGRCKESRRNGQS